MKRFCVEHCTYRMLEEKQLIVVSELGSNDEQCKTVKTVKKKSLHVLVHVNGKKVSALVDTGATSSFIQHTLVRKLNLQNLVQSCDQRVRFGNGEVEKVQGKLNAKIYIEGIPFQLEAFVLFGKGHVLILGFIFLKSNDLVVNCKKRILESGEGDKTLQCHRVHANEAKQFVYHHFFGGVIRIKHDGDAGFDCVLLRKYTCLQEKGKLWIWG